MSFRVIQWATGGVGRAAMEGVLAHPELMQRPIVVRAGKAVIARPSQRVDLVLP